MIRLYHSRLYYLTVRRGIRRLTPAGRIYVLLAALSFVLGLVWLTDTVSGLLQDMKSSARLKELQAVQAQAALAGQDAALTVPGPSILPGLAPLYEQNPELAGWLTIEGTLIDYPVLYSPEDEDFYLSHNFDQEPDKNGSLLIQAGCDPYTPGGNIIIHGHNLKNGLMFASLINYRDEAYFREHPLIRYSTLYEQGKYEIVAVFLTQVYKKSDNVFKYYHFFGADAPAEFNDFYDNIKALALYDTGVEAQFGDRFITLSTCAYHVENGRLAVVARAVK